MSSKTDILGLKAGSLQSVLGELDLVVANHARDLSIA